LINCFNNVSTCPPKHTQSENKTLELVLLKTILYFLMKIIIIIIIMIITYISTVI